ncbi:hypothetical protein CcaCcLH18_13911 [Colletotrichum camelliae]|nr:hypothetical protein CcaCcLH18_13911 [Colletotrichum camelliae]
MNSLHHTTLTNYHDQNKHIYRPPNAKDAISFSCTRFLKDAEWFCHILDAPFSASTTTAVLKAYQTHFHNAPVGWRVTSKDSALNYRFFQAISTNVVDTAIEAGFIKHSPLTDLVQAWSSLFDGEVQQWCDFDTSKGLMKAWLFLGQTRHMEDVIDVDFVPQRIRRHLGTFRDHGLDRVRTIAVDWHSRTINIYWRVPGPLSQWQAKELLGIAGCQSLEEDDVAVISKLSRAKDGSFAFALTLAFETGEIERAAFYATKLSRENLPVLDVRLAKFIQHAPDYDPQEWITVGWGFVKGGKRYMKAEKSYCGDFMGVVRDMMTKDPNI